MLFFTLSGCKEAHLRHDPNTPDKDGIYIHDPKACPDPPTVEKTDICKITKPPVEDLKKGCKEAHLRHDPNTPDKDGIYIHDQTKCAKKPGGKTPTYPPLVDKNFIAVDEELVEPSVADPFRKGGKYHWGFVNNAGVMNFEYLSSNSRRVAAVTPPKLYIEFADFGSGPPQPRDQNAAGPKVKKITIYGSTLAFPLNDAGFAKFQTYIDGIYNSLDPGKDNKDNIVFFDHAYQMEKPLDIKEIDLELNPIASIREKDFADFDVDYNFYIPEYEEATKKMSGINDEPLFPSLYTIQSERAGLENVLSDDDIPGEVYNTKFWKHITLDGNLESDKIVKDSKGKETRKVYNVKDTPYQEYFKLWGEQFVKIFASDMKDIVDIQTQHTNQIIDSFDFKRVISDAHPLRFMFPMFINLKFPTYNDSTDATLLLQNRKTPKDPKETFYDIFDDSNLYGYLLPGLETMNWAASDLDSDLSSKVDESAPSMLSFREFSELAFGQDFGKKIKFKREQQVVKRPSLNLRGFFAQIGKSFSGPASAIAPLFDASTVMNLVGLSGKGIYLGKYENDMKKVFNDKSFLLWKAFNLLQAFARFMSIYDNRGRTPEEVFGGMPSYSETVGFRIDKYGGEGTSKTLIQSFYLPNINKIDPNNPGNILRNIEFADTQVSYNKLYTYKIFAERVVIGTKYWYEGKRAGYPDYNKATKEVVKNFESLGHSVSFSLFYEPSIRAFEVPYATMKAKVLDNPPVPPNIRFIPYHSVNNRILIVLESGVGEIKAEPIIIERGDEKLYADIKEFKFKNPKKKEITFSSDDPVKSYDIYRIDFKPSSYTDFAEHKRIITANVSTAVSLVDHLAPNKDYYYVFRSKDIHDHVSLPSAIYKVRMVDDSGTIFPEIEIFDLKEKREVGKTFAKTAKKYIQIMPSVLQSILNTENSDIIDPNTGKKHTSAEKISSIALGNVETENTIWNDAEITKKATGAWSSRTKKYKLRVTSKTTGKKIDINFSFGLDHAYKNKP